ncbi:MAG TPA: glycine betaine ABC transporter substrate-binding protein, partial [Pirellulaceae bacterium]
MQILMMDWARLVPWAASGSPACLLALLVTAHTVWSTEPPRVRVGSKIFTESVVLGEIVTLLARDGGATADHRAELGGTQILWKALLAGEIDAYVEYTGTIREEILAPLLRQGNPLASESALRAALSDQGVLMSERIGFNNTYALGMRERLARSLSIRTIEDLVRHSQLKFGFSSEFMERDDGWPGLRTRYSLPQRDV